MIFECLTLLLIVENAQPARAPAAPVADETKTFCPPDTSGPIPLGIYPDSLLIIVSGCKVLSPSMCDEIKNENIQERQHMLLFSDGKVPDI
jgi:hypothetical protein